jgi:hypothetical protein
MSQCICPFGRTSSSYGQGNCPVHDTPAPPANDAGTPDEISDGFGSVWPRKCWCGKGINQIMRPGKIQCTHEHLHEYTRGEQSAWAQAIESCGGLAQKMWAANSATLPSEYKAALKTLQPDPNWALNDTTHTVRCPRCLTAIWLDNWLREYDKEVAAKARLTYGGEVNQTLVRGARLEELNSLLVLVHTSLQHIPIAAPQKCQFMICSDILERIAQLEREAKVSGG